MMSSSSFDHLFLLCVVTHDFISDLPLTTQKNDSIFVLADSLAELAHFTPAEIDVVID